MKSFGINIEQWVKSAFQLPVANALHEDETERQSLKRTPKPSRRHHRQGRRVCLEFIHRNAKRVRVAGSFNRWRPAATPMVSLGRGWWARGLVLPPGRYEYCLVVDGRWMPDPNAPESALTPEGRVNSVLVVPDLVNT